jgi:hypothetical protein
MLNRLERLPVVALWLELLVPPSLRLIDPYTHLLQSRNKVPARDQHNCALCFAITKRDEKILELQVAALGVLGKQIFMYTLLFSSARSA